MQGGKEFKSVTWADLDENKDEDENEDQDVDGDDDGDAVVVSELCCGEWMTEK